MIITERTHPAAIPGEARRLYLASFLIRWAGLAALYAALPLALADQGAALVFGGSGALLYVLGGVFRTRSWWFIPRASQDALAEPRWVVVATELSGLALVVGVVLVLQTFGPLGALAGLCLAPAAGGALLCDSILRRRQSPHAPIWPIILRTGWCAFLVRFTVIASASATGAGIAPYVLVAAVVAVLSAGVTIAVRFFQTG